MIDKSLRKATTERCGSVVVIRMTGGPDCLWLNMYLDTQQKQMTCDSDIGFYAYHWGRNANREVGFVPFCIRWLADENWLLRKCIGERHVPKQINKAATKKALMVAYVEENTNLDRDEFDAFLEAIEKAEQAEDVQTYSMILQAAEQCFTLPEDYYECFEEEYTPWQKRFAEICREVIVPELEKLMNQEV